MFTVCHKNDSESNALSQPTFAIIYQCLEDALHNQFRLMRGNKKDGKDGPTPLCPVLMVGYFYLFNRTVIELKIPPV